MDNLSKTQAQHIQIQKPLSIKILQWVYIIVGGFSLYSLLMRFYSFILVLRNPDVYTFFPTFVPNFLPLKNCLGLIEILASTLICPFSISASDIPRYLSVSCNSFANLRASSEDLITGLVTNSINGSPALLKSTRLPSSECEELAVSSSR